MLKFLMKAGRLIASDFRAIQPNDPACRNWREALLCYPGFQALLAYRIADVMWQYEGLKLAARILSTFARFLTGVDIHPGAQIGPSFFLDHGMGVVIGETAVIGRRCHMLHGVTLGGTGKHVGKRHPTVGDNVFLGAHAQLLGPIRIGSNSKIGAGAIVLTDVPAHATIVGGHKQRVILNRDVELGST